MFLFSTFSIVQRLYLYCYFLRENVNNVPKLLNYVCIADILSFNHFVLPFVLFVKDDLFSFCILTRVLFINHIIVSSIHVLIISSFNIQVFSSLLSLSFIGVCVSKMQLVYWRKPDPHVVFVWKIYAARRDCYLIDFNSILSFNECLMTKNLHKSIYSLEI